VAAPKNSFNPNLLDFVNSAPCGLMVANPKGVILFANKKAEDIFDAGHDSLLGRKVPSQLGSTASNRSTPYALKQKKLMGKEVGIYKAPLQTKGRLMGSLYFLFDDGNPQPAAKGHSLAPELMDSVIESFYDGVIFVENDRIVRVNSSYGRITGLKVESLLGQKVDDLDGETHICLHTIQEVVRLVCQLKKSVTSMGRLRQGNEIYVTATPVTSKGSIKYIIINIRDVTELQRLKEEVSRLMALYLSTPEEARISQITGDEIVTGNRAMRSTLDTVARLAQVDSVLFFEGESGTGKEVLARLAHRLSARSKGPFIPVNCGAIPENLFESELFGYAKGAFTGAVAEGKPGLFELAHNGVIFLDEVSETPLNCQVKLLKVLEDLEVTRVGGVKPTKLNVRVIGASNRSLPKMVKEGKFREDLFYRVYVVPIKIPPLRERRDDIFPLAWHFLRHYNDKFNMSKKFSPEIIQIMETYQWPGNVRELKNVIERTMITSEGETLEPRHLPPTVYQQETDDASMIQVKGIMPLDLARESVERKLLTQALAIRRTTREAAKILGVDHSTVVRKVRKYGIQVPAEPSEEEEPSSPETPPSFRPKLPFA
jgi:PAS domain S-box-containing protein